MSCGGTKPAAPAGPVKVTVHGYAFPPIVAKAGQSIEVLVTDPEHHTLTADDGTFDVGPVEPNVPKTFPAPSKAGSYAFACKIHPTMHGTLTVS